MEIFKVLLAEDDESARSKLAREIEKDGFTVITAENGQVAMDLFEKENPQIVITDLKMPGMSGMEILKRIKKMSPKTQVILMSAFGDMDTVIEALRAGVLDYIKKPIDLDLLSQALLQAQEIIIQ